MENYFNGAKLRELRKSKGMTTSELADEMGYSQSYISRFENDRAVPDINTLIKMLDILGTDIASFFSDELSIQQLNLIKSTEALSPKQIQLLIDFLSSINN